VDGRLIALAATAENLSSSFDLPKNVVYGLLRAVSVRSAAAWNMGQERLRRC